MYQPVSYDTCMRLLSSHCYQDAECYRHASKFPHAPFQQISVHAHSQSKYCLYFFYHRLILPVLFIPINGLRLVSLHSASSEIPHILRCISGVFLFLLISISSCECVMCLSSGCSNKAPWPVWLISNGSSFLTVAEAEVWVQGASMFGSGENILVACRPVTSLVALWPLLIRAQNPFRRALSLCPNYLQIPVHKD